MGKRLYTVKLSRVQIEAVAYVLQQLKNKASATRDIKEALGVLYDNLDGTVAKAEGNSRAEGK